MPEDLPIVGFPPIENARCHMCGVHRDLVVHEHQWVCTTCHAAHHRGRQKERSLSDDRQRSRGTRDWYNQYLGHFPEIEERSLHGVPADRDVTWTRMMAARNPASGEERSRRRNRASFRRAQGAGAIAPIKVKMIKNRSPRPETVDRMVDDAIDEAIATGEVDEDLVPVDEFV